MKEFEGILSEKGMDLVIAYILRIGVLLAAALVFAGGVIWLSGFFSKVPDYHFFSRDLSHFPGLLNIVKKTAVLDGTSLIQAGVLVLILTPVLRVVFSFVSFLIQKDKIYILCTLIVLLNLVYSLFGHN